MCAHLANNTTASILKPKIVNSAQNIDTSPSTPLTFLIFQLPYIDHSTLLHRPLPPAILNPFHQQQIHSLALYQKPINSISDRPSMASETNQPGSDSTTPVNGEIKPKDRPDNRYNRPGWFVSYRIPPGQRL
ncbi:hypothetical protein OIU84_030176 [Salix udensis]|uniref:Uncharacterized protein n=1 Tax=Salix udensis TaxID=889485 RepID=A0AAD6KBF2_9ROSI|nr:hypothetical protein OIU84_030176 [Salix udensis]